MPNKSVNLTANSFVSLCYSQQVTSVVICHYDQWLCKRRLCGFPGHTKHQIVGGEYHGK